jgi:phospholipid/cholesterol/gamma-HCH transport system substrate-binding protein
MALREFKVGAFVFVGLAAIGIVIFLIGDERGLFSPTDEYQVVFKDVEGLKRGSPVRMGGIDVGSVTSVSYGDNPNDPRLYVTISVATSEARRIRADSVVTIDAKGLLGDKMVTVTVGSPDQPPIPPGGTIRSGETVGLERVIQKVDRLGERAEQVMINLQKTTGSLADEQFRKDLQSAASSLNSILRSVDQGDGYAARLIRDPNEADRLSRTMASLEQTALQLQQTVSGINEVVARVNQGPGFAHDLIYGDAPTQTLVQFGEAAEEVALTLRGVREGDGLAHSLLYGGDETDDMMGNITAVSRDLRHIVGDIRAGKGTIGALLVDPSVYEDIKVLLGNVQRNRTLRALVRYSIKRDEQAGPVEVRDRTSPAAKAPSPAQKRNPARRGAESGPASGTGASSSLP